MNHFDISYKQHKEKCIANAGRIESAINQITNLKKATNYVMTGSTVNIVTGFFNGEASKESFELSREKYNNAHVARIDDKGHKELYYISFSYKDYETGPGTGEYHKSLIINKSQCDRGCITAYIFITPDEMFAVYPNEFKYKTRVTNKTRHEIVYTYSDEAHKLDNNEEFTQMNFTYLSKVDATKVNRSTGYFKCTVIYPHGTVEVFEGSSKREVYKKLFEESHLKVIDAISYNTFGYHFKKGSDWTIVNEETGSIITVQFESREPEKKIKSNKKVYTLADIQSIIDKEDEEDSVFERDFRVNCPEEILGWLKDQPEEFRTIATIRKYLQDPALFVKGVII